MKILCPYCKQPMTEHQSFPTMRPRKMRIYNAVVEAGPQGIKPEDLLVRMYDDGEWPTPGGPQVLRVMICEMNKVLEPHGQRIVNAYRGCYVLRHLPQAKGYKSNEAKAYSEPDH